MRWNILFYVFGVLILDQLTKIWVRNTLALGQSIAVIPGAFHLTHINNYGIGFGLLQNIVPFVILATILIIIGLLYYLRKVPQTVFITSAFALLLGGSIGNLIDRIFFGYVTDFVDFRIWPVFNVADSAVTIGGILLLIWFYCDAEKF